MFNRSPSILLLFLFILPACGSPAPPTGESGSAPGAPPDSPAGTQSSPPGSATTTIPSSSPTGTATSTPEPSPVPLLRTIRTDGRAVNGLAWSPDGSLLAGALADGTILVWEASSGEQGLSIDASYSLSSVAWSPDGRYLAAGYLDGNGSLYDAASGERIHMLFSQDTGYASAAAWSPNGGSLALGGYGVALFNPANGGAVRTLERYESTLYGTSDWATQTYGLAFSPGGSLLAVTSRDNKVRMIDIWNPSSGAFLDDVRSLKNGSCETVDDLAWSPDGGTLAASLGSGTISLLSTSTWTVTVKIDATKDCINGLAWSPDSAILAGAVYFDGVHFWNAYSGDELLEMETNLGIINALEWSPDGDLLAASWEDGVVTLWDVTNVAQLLVVPTPTATTARTPTPPPPVAAGSVMWSTLDQRPLVYVPGGTFLMGAAATDPDADPDEHPRHEVLLDAFWIDQYEVTHEAYTLCVEAGACNPPAEADDNGFLYEYAAEIRDGPVVNVTWSDAQAYCAWAGRRLPSEAEWEKAARGGDGRIYPWGDDPDAFHKAWYCEGCIYDPDHPDVLDDFSRPAAVGSFPDGASPYGALDMAGNVWEWVADWYSKTTYSQPALVNPPGPANGSYRVMRGGGWTSPAIDLRLTYRQAYVPFSAWIDVGFRCAMDDDRTLLTGMKP
ncbi:MAG: hypothetical protein FJZ96_00030 [Chloroflexi bacterium]|nr:hypothetical protein [Chloroflexota bacterium]